jgi:hypothetical protein
MMTIDELWQWMEAPEEGTDSSAPSILSEFEIIIETPIQIENCAKREIGFLKSFLTEGAIRNEKDSSSLVNTGFLIRKCGIC